MAPKRKYLDPSRYVTMNVENVPIDLRDQFKATASLRGYRMNEVVKRFMRDYIRSSEVFLEAQPNGVDYDLSNSSRLMIKALQEIQTTAGLSEDQQFALSQGLKAQARNGDV